MAPLAVTKARAEVILLVAFNGQWIFALHLFYRVSHKRLRIETKTKCWGAKFSHGYDLKAMDPAIVLLTKGQKNNFWSKPTEIATVARGFWLLLIERVRRRGFSSILFWVTFLRHPVSCYVNCLPMFVLLTSSHQVVDYMIPFYPDPFGLFVNMEVNKRQSKICKLTPFPGFFILVDFSVALPQRVVVLHLSKSDPSYLVVQKTIAMM